MNIIKKKAVAIFENSLLKYGTVLATRSWNPATFVEIDLHLPDVNMEKWESIQYIKIKVAEYTYRDYTPALWDTDTHTCTILINTSQAGPGSKWAASLKRGDVLPYLGIASSLHKPVLNKRLLCLGDTSSIGHFLALKQLAASNAEIYGAVSFKLQSHADEFSEYFDINLQPVIEKSWDFSLVSWVDKLDLNDETIYITGHTPTAVELRRHLRQREDFTGSIKLKGFWG